jgi:protein SERAC1
MEVLVPGAEPIQADIVFVHGLRGDRIKTWDVDGVLWPRDLLPKDLPNARIMSYSYDGMFLEIHLHC